MLVLLPPSEGKSTPRRGRPLDLAELSCPGLTETRSRVLDSLVRLCASHPDQAVDVLGLTPGLADEVARNAALLDAPAAPVSRVYTGVLYDALGLATLSTSAKRRASSRLLVTSSVFGLVRPGDRIPAYRLSGNVTLPGLGTVASVWREALAAAMPTVVGRHLVLDLRSGTYAGFWRPGPELAAQVVSMRVLHEADGKRTVVSHFNKATKGRLVRDLLEDGADPRIPKALVDVLTRLGWQVEPTPAARNGTERRPFAAGPSYDVVVTQI